MNIGESDHIAADEGIPTWTQNQRISDNNPLERLSIQIKQSENFGLGSPFYLTLFRLTMHCP